jgi:Lecithin retinol acyltransferase
MARGDHLQASRDLGYHHDGIDLGDGSVVHLAGEPLGSKNSARVRIDSIDVFCGDGIITIRPYSEMANPDQTIARAMSKIDDAAYDLVFNNCEHFATWCVTGRHDSDQVTMVASAGAIVGTTSVAAVMGADAIASVGIVAGMSGAGIMSGLAATGGLVGGGAVAGLGVLGAGPGVAGVVIVNRALRDDEFLTQDERDARAAGRVGSVVGAGGALVGGIGAVSAMGTVAGLSGAGISSGLAALGAGVGGGMAAGTAVVIAAPAAGAALVGYGIYRLVLWLRMT